MAQILVYLLIVLFISEVLIIKLDKKYILKQLLKGKYYSLEVMSGYRFMQYLLFYLFFMISLSIVLYENFELSFFLLAFLLTLLFVVLFFLTYQKLKRFKEEKEKILKEGVLVEGKVIQEHIEEIKGHKSYYMLVEYKQNDEVKRFMTPQVEFSFVNLMDKSVQVYLYEDRVFVTHFQLDFSKLRK